MKKLIVISLYLVASPIFLAGTTAMASTDQSQVRRLQEAISQLDAEQVKKIVGDMGSLAGIRGKHEDEQERPPRPAYQYFGLFAYLASGAEFHPDKQDNAPAIVQALLKAGYDPEDPYMLEYGRVSRPSEMSNQEGLEKSAFKPAIKAQLLDLLNSSH